MLPCWPTPNFMQLTSLTATDFFPQMPSASLHEGWLRLIESQASRDGGQFFTPTTSKRDSYQKESVSVWIPWEAAASHLFLNSWNEEYQQCKDALAATARCWLSTAQGRDWKKQNSKQMLIPNGKIFRDEDKISWPVDRPWSAIRHRKDQNSFVLLKQHRKDKGNTHALIVSHSRIGEVGRRACRLITGSRWETEMRLWYPGKMETPRDFGLENHRQARRMPVMAPAEAPQVSGKQKTRLSLLQLH